MFRGTVTFSVICCGSRAIELVLPGNTVEQASRLTRRYLGGGVKPSPYPSHEVDERVGEEPSQGDGHQADKGCKLPAVFSIRREDFAVAPLTSAAAVTPRSSKTSVVLACISASSSSNRRLRLLRSSPSKSPQHR